MANFPTLYPRKTQENQWFSEATNLEHCQKWVKKQYSLLDQPGKAGQKLFMGTRDGHYFAGENFVGEKRQNFVQKITTFPQQNFTR